MSRTFSGTAQTLSRSDVVVTAFPFTIACWFNASVDSSLCQFGFGDGTASNLVFMARLSTKNLRAAIITAGGAQFSADTVNTVNTGSWNAGVAVYNSNTDRRAYLNGDAANKGSNASSSTFPVMTKTEIGASGATSLLWNGQLAEIAVWNVALSEEEILLHYQGISPHFIRPANLVLYVPINGSSSPEPDKFSTTGFTVSGATAGTTAPSFGNSHRFGSVGLSTSEAS